MRIARDLLCVLQTYAQQSNSKYSFQIRTQIDRTKNAKQRKEKEESKMKNKEEKAKKHKMKQELEK